MPDTPEKARKPRGEHSVLGSKEEFKKDEAHGADDEQRDEKAKDEIGHMGEASRQKER